MEKVWYIALGNGAAFALLDYLFMPLLVECLLIGIAYLLRKYMPHVWKVLNGAR